MTQDTIKMADDGSNYAEFIEALPTEAKEIIQAMEEAHTQGLDYKELTQYQTKLKPLGITFDFGLDSEPYDFKYTPIT